MIEIIQRQGSLYSDSERHMAVMSYLILGNIRRVSEVTGIPSRTLYDWQKTEWWEDLAAQLRAERDAQLDSAFTKVIEMAMCSVMDRLENGDVVVMKDRTIIRKPISAHDATYILGTVLSMRERLRLAAQTKRVIPLHELAGMLETLGAGRASEEGFAKESGHCSTLPGHSL